MGAGWIIELGEFNGGFRIYRKEDEEACYYQNCLTFLRVQGMWQPSEKHEGIEVCRLTISQDGIEVIGAQSFEDLDFVISVEVNWHMRPRRLEGLFTDEDAFHMDDNLSIVRSNAIPGLGKNEPLELERPCLRWKGSIANVTISPILREPLYGEDVCPLYDLPEPQKNIRVRMVGNEK